MRAWKKVSSNERERCLLWWCEGEWPPKVHVWILGPQLVEPVGNDEEVGPCWRRCGCPWRWASCNIPSYLSLPHSCVSRPMLSASAPAPSLPAHCHDCHSPTLGNCEPKLNTFSYKLFQSWCFLHRNWKVTKTSPYFSFLQLLLYAGENCNLYSSHIYNTLSKKWGRESLGGMVSTYVKPMEGKVWPPKEAFLDDGGKGRQS